MKDKIEQLEQAKEAVLFCLKSADNSVSMHGLAYWAGRVEQLRKEIREEL